MYSDALGRRQFLRDQASDYCKRPMDVDRIKMKLQPIAYAAFGVNRQLAVVSDFALPRAQLNNMTSASKNANVTTWDLYQQPVF